MLFSLWPLSYCLGFEISLYSWWFIFFKSHNSVFLSFLAIFNIILIYMYTIYIFLYYLWIKCIHMIIWKIFFFFLSLSCFVCLVQTVSLVLSILDWCFLSDSAPWVFSNIYLYFLSDRDPFDKLFLPLSKEIVSNWKNVARHLDIVESNINIIDHNHSQVEEKAYRMLQKWKEINGCDVKKEVLIKALEECELKRVAELVEAWITSAAVQDENVSDLDLDGIGSSDGELELWVVKLLWEILEVLTR